MKRELVFLAKFAAIYIVLQAVIQFGPLLPLEEAIASLEAGWIGAENFGNIIDTGGNGLFEISASCTGLVSASVLAAVVFSLRKPKLKKKAMVFAVGAIALFVLNLARVYIVLVSAVQFGIGMSEIVHIVSWFSTAAFILAAWYFGTKRIAKVKDFSELL